MRRLFLAPAWVILAALFAAPMLVVIAYSGLTRGAYGGAYLPWTLENYARSLEPLYLGILLRTVAISASAAAVCLLLGFPLALAIARAIRFRSLLLQLVILPFWTSLLLRLYAWAFLLRDTGLINTALLRLGLISEPLPLLFSDGAVFAGLVYAHLPFAVLPLVTTVERVDPAVLDAAADLGASPSAVFWKVLVPLCGPGLAAAAVLVFIPCLGAFLTPDLLGGGKSVMAGNVIQNQFTTARDWPFGSALALLISVAVLVPSLLLGRARREAA